MTKPNVLYRLEVKTAPGDRLRYSEKGGGTFANLSAAKDRRRQVLRRHPNATVRIFRAEPEWIEVTA